jgi:hypothetical protein
MEVMRAGGVVVPLNGGGGLVEEVRQGHHLWHRSSMRRALGKARGQWIS